jgi:hypothetical protein
MRQVPTFAVVVRAKKNYNTVYRDKAGYSNCLRHLKMINFTKQQVTNLSNIPGMQMIDVSRGETNDMRSVHSAGAIPTHHVFCPHSLKDAMTTQTTNYVLGKLVLSKVPSSTHRIPWYMGYLGQQNLQTAKHAGVAFLYHKRPTRKLFSTVCNATTRQQWRSRHCQYPKPLSVSSDFEACHDQPPAFF